MRRRRWKAPNNPTVQAKQLWRAVYGEPWPKGWKVRWVGFMRNCSGLTSYERKEILLNYGDAKQGACNHDHEAMYLSALGWAFWYALTEVPSLRYLYSDVNRHGEVEHVYSGDYKQEQYERYCRWASTQRLELERHLTMERGAIEVVLHEFVHVRQPWLKHGKEFDRLDEWSRAKLMEARL